MSKYSVGDVINISGMKIDETIPVVITKIEKTGGDYYFFIRRKDNKVFKIGRNYRYNAWIKGPEIEVEENEKT